MYQLDGLIQFPELFPDTEVSYALQNILRQTVEHAMFV